MEGGGVLGSQGVGDILYQREKAKAITYERRNCRIIGEENAWREGLQRDIGNEIPWALEEDFPFPPLHEDNISIGELQNSIYFREKVVEVRRALRL